MAQTLKLTGQCELGTGEIEYGKLTSSETPPWMLFHLYSQAWGRLHLDCLDSPSNPARFLRIQPNALSQLLEPQVRQKCLPHRTTGYPVQSAALSRQA